MRGNPDRHMRINGRHQHSSVYQSFSVVIILCLSVILSSSCKSETSIFPSVPTNSGTTGETTLIIETIPSPNTDIPDVIRVAAPFSEETSIYLAKLYAAKKMGLIGSGITGQTVSLEYLQTIDPLFFVEHYTTSATGASFSSYKTWEEDGTIPDIIFTDSMSRMAELGLLLPLNDFLSGNPYIAPSNAYPYMTEQCTYLGKLLGIPYAASITVLFANTEILTAAGVELPYEVSFQDIVDAASAVNALNTPEILMDRHVVPIYSGSDMLPFLPASFDSTLGYMARKDDEIDTHSAGFADAMKFLRNIDPSYFVEEMSEEKINEVFGTMNPILAKRVAFWVGGSDEISRWANYMPYTLAITQIPSVNEGTYSPPALTVFPLCVSAFTEHPHEASDYAAFIALDPDAIMLRIRLNDYEGFLPVVKSPDVWDYSFTNVKYTGSFYKLKDYMSDAFYCPFVSDYDFFMQTEDFLNQYYAELINSDLPPHELIESIND